MKRVGYDSDSGRYYFRDREGVLYEGAQGAEFGEMTRGGLHYFITFFLFLKLFCSIWRTSCDTRREFW